MIKYGVFMFLFFLSCAVGVLFSVTQMMTAAVLDNDDNCNSKVAPLTWLEIQGFFGLILYLGTMMMFLMYDRLQKYGKCVGISSLVFVAMLQVVWFVLGGIISFHFCDFSDNTEMTNFMRFSVVFDCCLAAFNILIITIKAFNDRQFRSSEYDQI